MNITHEPSRMGDGASVPKMNSSGTQECFVYITLPGAVSAVSAGTFLLERDPRGNLLGHFVYDRSS